MMSHAEFYEAANLKANPFRSNATLDDDPRLEVWAGQSGERKLLEKFLARSKADQVGNTNLILLHGDWGTGKSHALLWGAQWLRKDTGGKKSSAYYIPTLKKDKGRISFAGAFVEDLLAKTNLLQDVIEFRQFVKTAISKYRDENGTPTKTQDDEVVEKIIPVVDLYNFVKELDRHEGETEIKAFLAPKGLTDYQAVTTFTRIVNLFVYEFRFVNETKRFRQSVHLMIDELDILRQASSKEILETNDLVRHLYDQCPNCFGLVLAVSAEQELLSSIFADYVLTRVSRQIEFKPFDRGAACEFVIQIMDESRVRPDSVPECGSYPFTPEALDAVLGQLTFKTPRKVVNVMQQLVEEARLAGLDPRKHPIDISALDGADIIDQVL
ncbi:hypothetical protein RMR10_001455 [Agrobacterium rosae]|uniref:hypothetical protein n=1 Tax=Agrobacterium rosae TaxID=1972867 RepID=UPI002A18535A|nr:hypothetical protein [Agrobacterium rosae]MDX8314463.1 hypothetical protein [Agrobacterium rosae]